MSGAELIAAERARQVSVEGYTSDHDQQHEMHELIAAAVCYAWSAASGREGGSHPHGMPPESWPWAMASWNPASTRIGNLIKAGALIAAEIDRLQRLKGGGL